MPTYGYRCTVCAEDFDVVQRMADEPGAACPACGAASTRQFFPAGILFKGSGFYKTDSRAKGGTSKAAEPAPASAEAPAKPAANGDAAKPSVDTGATPAATPPVTGAKASDAPAAPSNGKPSRPAGPSAPSSSG